MKPPAEQYGAVFLHAGWRCSSTYVWSRFRRNQSTTGFYEPFGESLSRCSPKRIRRQTAQGWNSRHPPLALPYAEEYCPLLRPLIKGVPGYRKEFALARYFPTSAGVGPEARYLSRLIKHARDRGTAAVFGFSRSLARASALKQALGGYHLVVRRNPMQQWLSCRSYRQEVPLAYFELSHFMILALAPPGSPGHRFSEMLNMPRLPRGLERQYNFLHGNLYPWSDELSYRAFYAVYLLSHAAAESAADLVLDVDRLARSPQYRDAVRTRILADVGLSVDFDDCRLPTRDPSLLSVDFAAVERDVRERLISCSADLTPVPAPAHALE